MVNLIDVLSKGIDLYSFFYSKIYGEIKFRPLTNLEIGMIMDSVFVGHSQEAKNLMKVVKFKMDVDINFTPELIDEVSRMYDEINKWIVYHAVKDFQPEEWQHSRDSIPLGIHLLESPHCCLEIDEFAEEVLLFSVMPKSEMRSFIESKSGDILAEAYWRLKYPLTDKMWELTGLQVKFISESSRYLKKKHKAENLDKFLRNEGKKPLKPMTKEDVNLVEKLERIKRRTNREL